MCIYVCMCVPVSLENPSKRFHQLPRSSADSLLYYFLNVFL